DFHEIFGRLAEDSAVKGVVVASAKPDNFVVGADVEMLARTKSAIEATALARGAQQALQRLEDLGKRKPVVAAIHGPALGGGLELALACTYQIALEDNPVGRKILFQQARKALLAKTHGHYPAPERALEAIRIGVEKGTEEGYRAEANFFGELVASDVSRRLVEIFLATQTLKKDTGVDEPSVKPR